MVGAWFNRGGRRNTNWKNKYNIRFFRFDTLRIATTNFSTIIGRGSYGTITLFKALLPCGSSVAILRFQKPYSDGFVEMAEFISHLRHINLIKIIGCCVENDEQLLVCEFAQNGSVWHHLQSRKRSRFNWERRASICIGIARGLSYLHEEIEPPVIHRGIKPSNILLDANFVPKIVDFDLIDLVDDCLYISGSESATKGKRGFKYPFPNNVFTGEVTEKVDVYSFGVTVLEIITGRNSIDMEIQDRWILHWVKAMKKDDMVLKIVDPMLTDFPKEDVERFINVALLCTHPISEQRPSMFEVVHLLYGRQKSDLEISEMATMAATAHQPMQWSSTTAYSVHTPVSMNSMIIGTLEKEDVKENESESGSCFWSSMISRGKGKCSSSRVVIEPAETISASSTAEEFRRTCFDKSMEKIKRSQMTEKKLSQRVSMEVVYPPLLSGRYRSPHLGP